MEYIFCNNNKRYVLDFEAKVGMRVSVLYQSQRIYFEEGCSGTIYHIDETRKRITMKRDDGLIGGGVPIYEEPYNGGLGYALEWGRCNIFSLGTIYCHNDGEGVLVVQRGIKPRYEAYRKYKARIVREIMRKPIKFSSFKHYSEVFTRYKHVDHAISDEQSVALSIIGKVSRLKPSVDKEYRGFL